MHLVFGFDCWFKLLNEVPIYIQFWGSNRGNSFVAVRQMKLKDKHIVLEKIV